MNVFGVSGFLGPWEGKLSSPEDKVVFRTPDYEVIDRVDYKAWQEWPNVRFDDYIITELIPQDTSNTYIQNVTIKIAKSIQKINPSLDGKYGGSWPAAVPTPKQQNLNYSSNTSLPVVKAVSKSPDKPSSTDDVRIKFQDRKSYLLSGTHGVISSMISSTMTSVPVGISSSAFVFALSSLRAPLIFTCTIPCPLFAGLKDKINENY